MKKSRIDIENWKYNNKKWKDAKFKNSEGNWGKTEIKLKLVAMILHVDLSKCSSAGTNSKAEEQKIPREVFLF